MVWNSSALPPRGKAGQRVARTCLVIREAAVRRAAAAEETLRDRDIFERVLPDGTPNGRITPNFGVARQHVVLLKTVL